MTDRDLASQAVRLETKALETAGTVIKTLIEALIDKCKNPEDRAVLEDFKEHVSAGGQLFACPINEDRLNEFKAQAEKHGLAYTSFQEKGRKEVRVVMFKDKDSGVMQKVIDEMTKDGRPLIDSMEMSATKLIEELGNSGLDVTKGFKSDKDLAIFRLSAAKNKVPFAFSMDEQKNVIVLTSSKDFENLKKVDGFIGLTTSHYLDDERKPMIDLIKEGIEERKSLEGKDNGHEFVRENTKSR